MNLRTKKLLDLYLGGFLLFTLKPLVWLVGKSLKRNHDPSPTGSIVVFKLLGGGSLVIAYPALLALRLRYPERNIILITTKAVAPFGQLLGVFSDIVYIDDQSILRLGVSSFRAWIRSLGSDTFIDLEVHSRLAAVFSSLSMARNRIGFYLESAHFKMYLYTHLVFFHRTRGSYHFYEAVAALLNCNIPTHASIRTHFAKQLESVDLGDRSPTLEKNEIRWGIFPFCSELGPERMFSDEQWVRIIERELANAKSNSKVQLLILGGPGDVKRALPLTDALSKSFPNIKLHNLAGVLNLAQSIKLISQLDRALSIDSSLLHFSRLLGIPTVSFWGPTDPESRLKHYPDLEEYTHYEKLPCSPCVHVAEEAPCNGRNRCMDSILDKGIEIKIPVVLG